MEITPQKLGLIILAIVTGLLLIVWIFPSFSPLQEIVAGFVNDTLGAEEIRQEYPPSFPPEHQAALERLKETIEIMVALSARDILGDGCFGNYAEVFPPNYGESGFPDFGSNNQQTVHIEIDYLNNGQTEFSVFGGEGGLQYLPDESFVIEGMHPCVIAGTALPGMNVPAENFYNRFNLLSDGALDPYYFPLDYLSLEWSGLGSGNNLRVSSNLGIINTEDNNLRDGGFIFTPDGEHICFFPTTDGRNPNEDGLPWVKVSGPITITENILRNLISGRGTRLCTGLDYSNR